MIRVRQPEKNPQREKRVKNRLLEIDPLLDVKWIPVAHLHRDSNDNVTRYEGRYALITYYRPNDPMRIFAEVAGRGLPYEILGWFCTDATDSSTLPLPIDETLPRMERWLGLMDNENISWKQRMRESENHNKSLTEKRMHDYADDAGYAAGEIYRDSLRKASRPGAAPFVQGWDF